MCAQCSCGFEISLAHLQLLLASNELEAYVETDVVRCKRSWSNFLNIIQLQDYSKFVYFGII